MPGDKARRTAGNGGFYGSFFSSDRAVQHGGADCPAERYPLYEEKLARIFAALRRDLSLSDVPFLVGGLGDFLPQRVSNPGLSNDIYVNAALRHYAGTHPRTGYVPAEGLTSNSDYLHFSAEALLAFGRRYYRVFRELEDKNKIFPEKPDADLSRRTEMERL